MASNITTPNTISFGTLIAPDAASQQLALQRRQQLVDALRQQALTPLDQQVVTGAGPARVVPISPWEGATKMLTAALVGSQQADIDKQNLQINRDLARRYADVLRGGDDSASAAPPSAGNQGVEAQTASQLGISLPKEGIFGPLQQGEPALAAAPAGQLRPSGDGSSSPSTTMDAKRAETAPAITRQSPYSEGNLLRGAVIAQLGGEPAAAAFWDQFKLTEFAKMLRSAGIDPASSRGQQLILANVQKQNYTPPVSGRPGGTLTYADGRQEQLPSAIEGAQAVKNPDGTWSYRPMQGASAAMSSAAAARTLGEGQGMPYTGFDAQGRPLPVTSRTAAVTQGASSAPSASPPGGAPADADRAAIFQAELAKAQDRLANPQKYMSPADLQQDPNGALFRQRAQGDIDGIQRELARLRPVATSPAPSGGGQVYGAQPPGYATGQEAAQTELSKKWTDLNAANSQAQTTSSYLDNIKQLATQAATGPFTSKLQFANALLAQVGSERAQDATTANALLDKYSNQIVARLGGNGALGTDAARALLQSAYPNAKMTPQAIAEAADNLKGANEMVKAKAAFLQPHAVKRDPEAYQQREMLFDQNADPRLWQLKNMDAASAARYLGALPPAVQADLRRRALLLKQAGVL